VSLGAETRRQGDKETRRGRQGLLLVSLSPCLLVCLCLYLLFFHRLGDRDLWSSHEARAAMDAAGVLDGAWDVPALYDGQPELQKPPLYYWLVALAARTLPGGVVDAWAVRLPSALAALGCVGLLAWRGRRGGAGLAAAVILATAIHFTWLARIGRIDMPLTFCVTLAVLAFDGARRREGAAWFVRLLSGYLALAAGVLLKGPIGFVLPATVVGVQRLVEGELPPPWRLRDCGRLVHALGVWWGPPLTLGLTVPWFVWADVRTGGEFSRVFFWYHNVARGLGGEALRSHPWYQYVGFAALYLLPWTPLVPVAAWLTWRRGLWRLSPDVRLGVVWFLTVFALLSCARFKRADYLLPAYPGAALFLGGVFSSLRPGLPFRGRQRALAVTVLLLAALGWTYRTEVSLPAEEPRRDYRRFAALVRAEAPPPEEVLFFQTEAHALAFRTGRPLTVLVQWEDLAERLNRPGVHHVVLPPHCADEAGRRLPGVRLERLAATTDAEPRHERPLVLLRARADATPR
jgi:4-amino-4-deoxy-L-arabinose transferase-like glycosyltransferase